MTRTIFWCVALVFAFIAASCGKDTVTDKPPTVQSSSAPAAAPSDPPGEVAKPAAEKPAAKASFDHAAWDGLLKKYVTEAGPVKYQAWKSNAEDMKALNAYTGRIAAASLADLNKPEHKRFNNFRAAGPRKTSTSSVRKSWSSSQANFFSIIF